MCHMSLSVLVDSFIFACKNVLRRCIIILLLKNTQKCFCSLRVDSDWEQ